MVVVIRGSGLNVVIYVDDHGPPHVHVVGDGRAKIDLGTAGGHASLVWARGMKQTDIRRAVKLVEQHRAYLIDQWKLIHG